MSKNKVNQIIAEDWKNLGFYYKKDDENSSWQIYGSKKGIKKFIQLLKNYSSNPANKNLSKHEHYGIYGYLKIVTKKIPKITKHQIEGSVRDIKNLANLIDKGMKFSKSKKIVIDEEYSKFNNYKIVIYLQDDDFDPSSMDPLIL